jgi:hypothetical protein
MEKFVLDATAASGFQAPGTDNILVSVRKSITPLCAAGYGPNMLVLTPAIDEAIDVRVSGITGGSADSVLAPGQFAPGTLFGLNRRVAKTVAAPVVMDAQACELGAWRGRTRIPAPAARRKNKPPRKRGRVSKRKGLPNERRADPPVIGRSARQARSGR